MRIGCIVNPIAGWGRGAHAGNLLQRVLGELSLPHQIHYTEGSIGAAPLAESLLVAGVECLVVVGGDGTFSQVAAVAAGGEVPVALVPAGTGNAMARALGARADADWMRSLFAHPSVHKLDMGLIGGRPFAAVAGLGFDAELVRALRRSVLLPRIAAWVATGVTHLNKLRPFRIGLESPDCATAASLPSHHHVSLRAALCLAVCNGPFYGAGIPMAPGAELTDGMLDFCLIGDVPMVGMPQLAAALVAGRHLGHRAVRAWRGTDLLVTTDPPVPWHADGEQGGETPVRITVRPSCLPVMLPRLYTAGR